jgi:hypothetical protein
VWPLHYGVDAVDGWIGWAQRKKPGSWTIFDSYSKGRRLAEVGVSKKVKKVLNNMFVICKTVL